MPSRPFRLVLLVAALVTFAGCGSDSFDCTAYYGATTQPIEVGFANTQVNAKSAGAAAGKCESTDSYQKQAAAAGFLSFHCVCGNSSVKTAP